MKITVFRVLLAMFFISFLVSSFSSYAAQCLQFKESTNNTEVFYSDSFELSGCPYTAILNSAEYARFELLEEQQEISDLVTTEKVLYAFTWGFSVRMLFWFFGWKVKTAKQVIKML